MSTYVLIEVTLAKRESKGIKIHVCCMTPCSMAQSLTLTPQPLQQHNSNSCYSKITLRTARELTKSINIKSTVSFVQFTSHVQKLQIQNTLIPQSMDILLSFFILFQEHPSQV